MKLFGILSIAALTAGVTAIIPTPAGGSGIYPSHTVAPPQSTTELSATSVTASPSTAAPDIFNTSTLKTDSAGFIELHQDGVIRSWAANGTVVDAAKLSTTQLLTYIANNVHGLNKTAHYNMLKDFSAIDGNDVTDEKQIREPSAEHMPSQFLDSAGKGISPRMVGPPIVPIILPPPGCPAIRCENNQLCRNYCSECLYLRAYGYDGCVQEVCCEPGRADDGS